ncbi:molybdate transport system regulatory protein [Polaromonas sp. OV174]|uniref:TOBE domain-containing protein n=1 Tax=Polaromonas sp. OV174 TaxID=1855300 RepID=UPI0008F3EE9C|nr:TOBE domain-containing protein [Polaromonas sp. OV174]SFC74548.1 molybdate transport system regulatory protein [Polaromonas sp. OV174]
MKPAAKTSLSFDSALSHEPADKRIEILRLIGESGSISQAGREAGVSYKAAWQAIDTLTNLAGVMLVQRAVGGAGGGGASLTEAGSQLLAVAGQLAESRRQVLAQAAGQLQPAMAAPALGRIGVRTSMRNQLPCQVERLSAQGQMVRVALRLAGGDLLVSRITKASAELLGLKKGLAVLALCKATAVQVTAQAPDVDGALAAPGRQALNGRVVRINRGASGDEVSLQLASGLQLVGFAAAGSGLKSRAAVTAHVDESAVVIALEA